MAPVLSAAAQEPADHATPSPGTPSPSLEDHELVRLLISGSEEALGLLYDRHAAIVHAVATRIGGDRSIAEEVVQETFLALWDRAEAFDPARGTLRTWLLAIARNRAIDVLRSRRVHDQAAAFSSYESGGRDPALVAEWLATTAAPVAMALPAERPDDALIGRETRETLAAAIAGLPPDERRVIELAYGDGLTQAEVAETLGWPLGTVKTRTRRALRRLRSVVDEPEDGPADDGPGYLSSSRSSLRSTIASPATPITARYATLKTSDGSSAPIVSDRMMCTP